MPSDKKKQNKKKTIINCWKSQKSIFGVQWHASYSAPVWLLVFFNTFHQVNHLISASLEKKNAEVSLFPELFIVRERKQNAHEGAAPDLTTPPCVKERLLRTQSTMKWKTITVVHTQTAAQNWLQHSNHTNIFYPVASKQSKLLKPAAQCQRGYCTLLPSVQRQQQRTERSCAWTPPGTVCGASGRGSGASSWWCGTRASGETSGTSFHGMSGAICFPTSFLFQEETFPWKDIKCKDYLVWIRKGKVILPFARRILSIM